MKMMLTHTALAIALVSAQDTAQPPGFTPFVLQRVDSIAEALEELSGDYVILTQRIARL